MTTELKKFTDAYATMTIATYEPLILKWYSGWCLYTLASGMAWRLPKAKRVQLDKALATAQALNLAPLRPPLKPPPMPNPAARPPVKLVDVEGNLIAAAAIKEAKIAGYPDALIVGDALYPFGGLRVVPKFDRPDGKPAADGAGPLATVLTLPTVLNGQLGVVDADFDYRATRRQVFLKLTGAINEVLADANKKLETVLLNALKDVGGVALYEFLPRGRLQEALSPIGISHYFRQLYFNVGEGVGPVEEAFTIAPLETLEVAYETTRRQIHEEFIESGSEVVSEQAVETKNLDEVSDKVSSMVQRDTSAAMSAGASGSIGVWEVEAETAVNLAVSSQHSREETARRLKEVTKRASERITKTFSLKTRDVQEVTAVSLTRRTIKNESAQPVSYGLRRVLRRVRVKVQDLGPRLVWQLYVRNPGAGLAQSRFVHFREAEPLAPPEVPPGVRPRPSGGTDTGSTSCTVLWDGSQNTHFVTLVLVAGADRQVTAVSIDSITDLEGGGKDDAAPAPLNSVQWGQSWNPTTNTYTLNVAIHRGDSDNVTLTYSYSWKPSQKVLDEWEAERKAALDKLTQDALEEQFQRQKKLITERSRIRSRPANDLRLEERYEIMNRLVSHLFARGDDPSEPTPLEIEYFHRFFEIGAMFLYTHPSWWKPRYARAGSSLNREAYEITSDSGPAPMGSSLGWMIQLDGDTRRHEFLNSPWARVCLPIRPGREAEALPWLAKHVEGELGYDLTKPPLKGLLDSIKQTRDKQAQLGVNGPDYVTVDSTVGAPAGPVSPQNVYPIIDQFDVTVPTDGFVYDELKVLV